MFCTSLVYTVILIHYLDVSKQEHYPVDFLCISCCISAGWQTWKQSSRICCFPPPASQIRNHPRQGKHCMNSSKLYTRGSFPQKVTPLWHPLSHYIIFSPSTQKYTRLRWNRLPFKPSSLASSSIAAGQWCRGEYKERVPGKFCPEMWSSKRDKAQHWHVAEKPPHTNHVHPAASPNSCVEHRSNFTDYILYWPKRPLMVKLLMSTLTRKAEINLPQGSWASISEGWNMDNCVPHC